MEFVATKVNKRNYFCKYHFKSHIYLLTSTIFQITPQEEGHPTICASNCFDSNPVPRNVTDLVEDTYFDVFRPVNSTNIGRIASVLRYCE